MALSQRISLRIHRSYLFGNAARVLYHPTSYILPFGDILVICTTIDPSQK